MGTSYFAPQAYTKETLAEAFEWLKKQPPHVRQFTKSADELVSLYLNSKKQDGRVSESFIKDLAGLAKDLEAFEDEKPSIPNFEMPQTHMEPSPKTKPAVTSAPTQVSNQLNNPPANSPVNIGLDNRSQEFINQTKHRFNLTSDDEALRMLIVLGYEKIQSI